MPVSAFLVSPAFAQAPASSAGRAEAAIDRQEAAARQKKQKEQQDAQRAADTSRSKVQADVRSGAPASVLRTDFERYRSDALNARRTGGR